MGSLHVVDGAGRVVHSQGRYQVSVVSLINKCDLFKTNPGLAIAPYRVASGVCLEDFRDSVSALEAKPININDRNFPGLSQLSEEFGFQSLSKKLSAHRRSAGLSSAQTAECLSRISVLEDLTVEGIPLDEFTFTIIDKAFPTSLLRQCYYRVQLENNFKSMSARRVDICAPGIDSTGFSSLQCLLSGKEVLLQKSPQKSLIVFSQQLLKVRFQRLFYGLWSNSPIDSAVTLSSAFAAHSPIYFQSV
jgi:hypothetical protein